MFQSVVIQINVHMFTVSIKPYTMSYVLPLPFWLELKRWLKRRRNRWLKFVAMYVQIIGGLARDIVRVEVVTESLLAASWESWAACWCFGAPPDPNMYSKMHPQTTNVIMQWFPKSNKLEREREREREQE